MFPVQDLQFALYIQHLSETTESRAAVEVAVNAVSWAHQMAGLQPISSSPVVRAVLGGLQRQLAKPKIQEGAPSLWECWQLWYNLVLAHWQICV